MRVSPSTPDKTALARTSCLDGQERPAAPLPEARGARSSAGPGRCGRSLAKGWMDPGQGHGVGVRGGSVVGEGLQAFSQCTRREGLELGCQGENATPTPPAAFFKAYI